MSDELLQKIMTAFAIPADVLGDPKGSQYAESELARKAWHDKVFPPPPKYRTVVTFLEDGRMLITFEDEVKS